MNQLINQAKNITQDIVQNLSQSTVQSAVNLNAGLTTKPITNQLDTHIPPFIQGISSAFVTKPKQASSLGVIRRQTAKHWHFLDAQDELSRSFELIKVLRQHQANKRWTLLIAPSHIPDKALLDCCSVDMKHVLIVREKQITSMSKTIETALSCNTCCAIVAWCSQWHEQLSAQQLQQLSQLADDTQCHVYAFEKQQTKQIESNLELVIEH